MGDDGEGVLVKVKEYGRWCENTGSNKQTTCGYLIEVMGIMYKVKWIVKRPEWGSSQWNRCQKKIKFADAEDLITCYSTHVITYDVIAFHKKILLAVKCHGYNRTLLE